MIGTRFTSLQYFVLKYIGVVFFVCVYFLYMHNLIPVIAFRSYIMIEMDVLYPKISSLLNKSFLDDQLLINSKENNRKCIEIY